METAIGASASAGDVAGVLRYLRLNEDDVYHSYECYTIFQAFETRNATSVNAFRSFFGAFIT